MSAEKKISPRSQQATVRHPDKIPELYADGAGFLAGWPVSKIVFNTVVPKEPGDSNLTENRQAVMVVTLPTAVVIEMSRNLLAAFVANKEQLNVASETYLSNINTMLTATQHVVQTSPAAPSTAAKKAK